MLADRSRFDVIVIGGGTAGCVVASELVRAGASVAIVEGGPDYGPQRNGRWPREFLDPASQPRTHDWGFEEERADGSVFPEPRARVLGGCSAHNECAAIWGQPQDYDAWETAGSIGWGWQGLRPLLDRIEQASPPQPHRGAHGPLRTAARIDVQRSSWQQAFLEAATDAGFASLADAGEPSAREGVAPFYVNVVDGVRQNAAFAFLDAVRGRRELAIIDDALADRLVLEAGQARAILCQRRGEPLEIKADRFVLCAGTYGSPAILLRSGVGPRRALEAIRVRCVLDLPGVGANLHDHPGVALEFQPTPSAAKAARDELVSGTLSAHPVVLRAKSDPRLDLFDLHVLPYQPSDDDTGGRRFGLLAFSLTPQARGSLEQRSADPRTAPRIRLSLLTDAADREAVHRGVRLARDLATRAPLASLIARELEPSVRIANDDTERIPQEAITSYAHPVGTCKMGPAGDRAAVVDHRGRVRGLENVTVADASIVPTIPRANTNLTVMLVAMRVAGTLVSGV